MSIQSFYEIDPLGDVLLVLSHGVQDANEEPQFEDCDSDTSLDAVLLDDLMINSSLESSSSEPELKAMSSHQQSFWPVRLRVSSLRLRKCSSVFKDLLEQYVGSPGDKEQTYQGIYIPIWNDEPSALAIVLDLVHNNDQLEDLEYEELRTVLPAAQRYKVDAKMLSRIAVVVEKYQLHDAMDEYLVKWVEGLWNGLENMSIPDAIAWLWITWCFELKDYFDMTTAYLMSTGTTILETGNGADFPIPSNILQTINDNRLDSIQELYTLFCSKLLPALDIAGDNKAHLGSITIVRESFAIGQLLVVGKSIGFWPSHPPHFEGISFAKAAILLKDMADLGELHIMFPDNRVYKLEGHLSFNTDFIRLIDAIEERIKGLEIVGFKK